MKEGARPSNQTALTLLLMGLAALSMILLDIGGTVQEGPGIFRGIYPDLEPLPGWVPLVAALAFLGLWTVAALGSGRLLEPAGGGRFLVPGLLVGYGALLLAAGLNPFTRNLVTYLVLLKSAVIPGALLLLWISRSAGDLPGRGRLAAFLLWILSASILLASGWLLRMLYSRFTNALGVGLIGAILGIYLLSRGPLTIDRVRRSLRWALLLSPLLLIVPVASFQLDEEFRPVRARASRPVILITIDSLRRDALSCYEPRAGLTPRIDGLARDGLLFEEARAMSSWTVPSVASILTGLSPRVHQLRRYDNRFPGQLPTIALALRRAGYLTAGLVDHFFFHPKFNYHKDFGFYRSYPRREPIPVHHGLALDLTGFSGDRKELSTMELAEQAGRWIHWHRGKNFFLWIHLFDPHHPYAPPGKYLAGVRRPDSMGLEIDIEEIERRQADLTPTEAAWIRTLYDGEVRYVDDAVGVILEALRECGLYDPSLLVLTSDHGDGFGEHGYYSHGQTLFDELLLVPLIVKLPGSSTVGRVQGSASNGSILPTILDVCGIGYDADRLSTGSLTGRIEHRESIGGAVPSTVFREGQELDSICLDGLKYIPPTESEEPMLFALEEDPGEETNLAETRPGEIRRAEIELEDYRQRSERLRQLYQVTTEDRVELDREVIESLEALGYVQ